MDKSVSVIVSKCTPNGDRVYGENLVNETFKNPPALENATAFGNLLREKGKSVLVRPQYNEKDEKGKFFREWRSFNGEPFKEVRWEIDF
jgi:hypothetical protein